LDTKGVVDDYHRKRENQKKRHQRRYMFLCVSCCLLVSIALIIALLSIFLRKLNKPQSNYKQLNE